MGKEIIKSSYSILSQRRYLFTDVRHIHCGELEWYSPDGNLLPLTAPPEPPVDAHAKTGFVPHGIRLTCHPAAKTDRLPEGTPCAAREGHGGNPVWREQLSSQISSLENSCEKAW